MTLFWAVVSVKLSKCSHPNSHSIENTRLSGESSRFIFFASAFPRYDLLVYVIRIEAKVDAFSPTTTSEELLLLLHSALALRVPRRSISSWGPRPRSRTRPRATVARVEAMLPNLSTWNFLCSSTLRDNFSSFGWLPEVRNASDNNASIFCVHKSLPYFFAAYIYPTLPSTQIHKK